jgi:hypothetical protein
MVHNPIPMEKVLLNGEQEANWILAQNKRSLKLVTEFRSTGMASSALNVITPTIERIAET